MFIASLSPNIQFFLDLFWAFVVWSELVFALLNFIPNDMSQNGGFVSLRTKTNGLHLTNPQTTVALVRLIYRQRQLLLNIFSGRCFWWFHWGRSHYLTFSMRRVTIYLVSHYLLSVAVIHFDFFFWPVLFWERLRGIWRGGGGRISLAFMAQ